MPKITPNNPKITHVDDWLDTPSFGKTVSNEPNINYAKFVLDYYRYPAWKISAYIPFMSQFQLYCTYEGAFYRVTGASRMGDIWLRRNPDQESGYDLRVDVAKCSQWRPTFLIPVSGE